MQTLVRWALVPLSASFALACVTPQEVAKQNKRQCMKIKRTGSRIARMECTGEPPLGLGVMNREAWRHANRGSQPGIQQGNPVLGPQGRPGGQ